MQDSDLLHIKQRFGIIGSSTTLNHAIQVATQVAATDMTVLITGESGSGKESFSKIIHSLSARKHKQFIAINCGAIPEGTIDSELFGHEKGSFTGAVDSRKGYFEVTNEGTIFLDEIGEMPLGTQARLLRVLENGEYIKVGSSKVNKTNVRIIAATNVNLLEAVDKGKFREDLYYRLNTVPIFVPPLRERGNDIELLFRKFATDFADEHRVKPIKLDDDAKNALVKYRFPGNIRQLKNLADQISVLEMGQNISLETLNKYLPQERNLPTLYKTGSDSESGMNERELLYKILFDMKKDVSELKKLVFSLKNSNVSSGDIINENKDLFKDIDEPFTPAESKPVLIESTTTPYQEPINIESVRNIDEGTQDVSHELHFESLSLEDKEKELIIKALRKNKNKRKNAAQDLGISERTLYRKIKQYDIEKQ